MIVMATLDFTSGMWSSTFVLGVFSLFLLALFSLWIIAFLILCVVRFGTHFKRGAKRHFGLYDGEPRFKEIDDCMKGGSEPYKQYRLCIYYINKIYSDIEILENEKIIEELYRRRDFLEKDMATLSHLAKVAMLSISALVALLVNHFFSPITIITETTRTVAVIASVTLFVALVSLIVFRAIDGRFGSYLHEVQKYELKKIGKCLLEIYEGIESDSSEETKIKMSIQRTQGIAASLIFGKQSWKLFGSNTGKKIMNLDLSALSDDDISNCEPIEATVKDKKIIFMLDKRKWSTEDICKKCDDCKHKKITETQFEKLLISDDYRTLYTYLKKYFGEKMVLDEEYVTH